MDPAAQGLSRADGSDVEVEGLEDYLGPWQYLGRRMRLQRQVRRSIGSYDAFLLRAPGAVAYLAGQELARRGMPFGVEVLGDPWESLGPGRVTSPWRPLARRWSRQWLRRLCRRASTICYVTRHWLQQRYPPGEGAVFCCSDARVTSLAGERELAARAQRRREAVRRNRPWQLGFIGSLERLYKAPDAHLRAVEICRRRGVDVRFAVVGEGRCRPQLERLSQQLGLGESVRFWGAVPAGRPVEEFLDGIDLFLLASHTEGLPRAMIEALSRSCPAIGSTAGGIPELLAPEDLVPPGDPVALASKILEVLQDPARLERMSRRNLDRAGSFTRDRLAATHRKFLEEIRRRAKAGR